MEEELSLVSVELEVVSAVSECESDSWFELEEGMKYPEDNDDESSGSTTLNSFSSGKRTWSFQLVALMGICMAVRLATLEASEACSRSIYCSWVSLGNSGLVVCSGGGAGWGVGRGLLTLSMMRTQ